MTAWLTAWVEFFFLIAEPEHKQTKILGNRCELNELCELDPGEDRTIKCLVAGL